jgi:Flp pilus assembly protein TadG
MKRRKVAVRGRRKREQGQALLFVLLGLGLFLLGAMAFAVDVSNLWFNRQAAQTAADAACTAGAMDLLVDAVNGTTTQGGFTAGSGFDCHSATTAAPCKYAQQNGFASTVAAGSTALGNNVSVQFPASVPGIVTPPASLAPTPFIKVIVTDTIPTFFVGLLSGTTKQSVNGLAQCGLTRSEAPHPLAVLNPQGAGTLTVQGPVAISGGPTQSIQVNSSDANAVNLGGQFDLSQGGPNFTGSDLGVQGGPTSPSSNFNPGTTGHWFAPSAPISDPFGPTQMPL